MITMLRAVVIATGALAMLLSAASIAQSERVRELLRAADADLRAMRLTTPPGANAYERYRRALELDPGNWRAITGFGEIVERYVGLADEAIAAGRYDRASQLLDRANQVMPGHELVSMSRADLERARGDELRGLPLSTAPARPAGERPAPAPGSPAPAPAPAPATSRFAIFPFDFIVPCYIPMGKEERTYLTRLTEGRPDTELAWSYYAEAVDESAIPRPRTLWDGNRAHGKPAVPRVVAAGRSLGVEAVLMAWYFCSQSPRILDFTYEVTLFLVDVERERMYTSHQNITNGSDGVRDVFEQFLAAR